VSFAVQDLCDISFSGEFDFVLSRKMLYYLPDIKRRRGMTLMLAALKADIPPSHLIFDGYTRKQPFFAELWETAQAGRGHP
jgi:hypothetical protein